MALLTITLTVEADDQDQRDIDELRNRVYNGVGPWFEIIELDIARDAAAEQLAAAAGVEWGGK